MTAEVPSSEHGHSKLDSIKGMVMRPSKPEDGSVRRMFQPDVSLVLRFMSFEDLAALPR